MANPVVTQKDLTRRLAVNVRHARNAAGLTLKAAAGKVDMHWRHLQKIEAAEVNVTLHTLVRLGEVLNVDPAHLLREPPAGVVAKVVVAKAAVAKMSRKKVAG